MRMKFKEEISEEWKRQMEYFSRKCKFTKEEEALIMKISKKVNLPPQRVIETIGVNSPYGKLDEDAISNLEISIAWYLKNISKNEEKLKQLVNKNKEKKGIFEKIKGMFSEEELLKSEIEHDKRRVERYKKIKTILEEVKNSIYGEEITKKINKNTNYKSMQEMWY
ncbi:MAG: hypothetical protein NZ903_01015 [Candidatus Micrarchaeota archaeon]|nr:hypothetical protein [Candidatus Micrarchaeota archaeon]